MIQTVNAYLKGLHDSVGPYDHSSVVRAVRRAGIDENMLSVPPTEFIADCAVWAAANRKMLADELKPGTDRDQALDRLAGRIVDGVASSWRARYVLHTHKGGFLSADNVLENAGISRQHREQALMTVREYLREQST